MPSHSPSPTDAKAVEEKALLDAYRHYWAEQVKAYRTGTIRGTALPKYAVGEALARVEGDLQTMRDIGVVAAGAPRSDVRVTRLNLQARVPSAALTDCLDISAWKRLYRSTCREVPTPTGHIDHYRTDVTAEKWGKQWKILSATPQQQQECATG
ncbi:hypothetical protein J8N05_18860 [Streptomyces sp. BH-SS-21]|uniref:Uncharacterized protein n=1 Tax=Streptomyces liliiviolaceus TaxID=2823109 RepID=A0A940Y433_9ACTN|nr:hypothetical protein [Streptomyces liliiviolaceus]MBQ0850254.1 hypothetical protein [Streptomyces liliiviolaceus]